MMKYILVLTLTLCVLPGWLSAQNVGISDDNATPDPVAMLEVRRGSHAMLRLASKSRSDSTGITFSNRVGGEKSAGGTDFYIGHIGENGLFFSAQSDLSTHSTADILVLKPNGRVGVGTPAPQYAFHTLTSTQSRAGFFENNYTGSDDQFGLFARANASGSGPRYGVYGETVASGGINTYGVYGYATGSSGMRYGVYGKSTGASGYGVYGENTSASGYAGYFAGTTKSEGDLIIGDSKAVFDLNGYQSALAATFWDDAAVKTIEFRTKDNSGETGGEINLYSSTGRTVEIDGNFGGDNSARINLYQNGETTVMIDGNWENTGRGRVLTDELQILGGSDLAENFDITAIEEGAFPAPGYLVSIAPDGSGRLNVSNIPYDTKVAGVISGAGEVRPGMVMGQKGSIADGEWPVALTGRVYVWADASQHPIAPGDLLTTSAISGHAMKATDRSKTHGAVVGKAMSSLNSGKGLVLLLVNLQ